MASSWPYQDGSLTHSRYEAAMQALTNLPQRRKATAEDHAVSRLVLSTVDTRGDAAAGDLVASRGALESAIERLSRVTQRQGGRAVFDAAGTYHVEMNAAATADATPVQKFKQPPRALPHALSSGPSFLIGSASSPLTFSTYRGTGGAGGGPHPFLGTPPEFPGLHHHRHHTPATEDPSALLSPIHPMLDMNAP